MKKLIVALFAASFVFGSVFAFAAGASDQARKKQSITCPPEHSFTDQATDNGIFACPSSGKEETIRQDEWRRKWTGIPKENWDKMTDDEKDKAFVKPHELTTRKQKLIGDFPSPHNPAPGKPLQGMPKDDTGNERALEVVRVSCPARCTIFGSTDCELVPI